MKTRIITNGSTMYLAPKGVRLPSGNFEIGPRDENGIRHVSGVYYVSYITGSPREIAEIPRLPISWL